MKSYKCTDGFVTKTISAQNAQDAADQYAIVSCTVSVTEVDDEGADIGGAVNVEITRA